ncbi:MAG: rod-binding protein [Synergistetes bacterium]|nr:rod-binding protein [Synergistota bacterium]MDW8192950.1 rod-binding protein [Synergistota bacterium]
MQSLRLCNDYFLGPASLPRDKKEALRVVSQEFEAIFVHMLLRQMRKTVPQDGLLPESRAMEIYKDMFDLALSKEIAKRELFGIAKMLYKEYEKSLK